MGAPKKGKITQFYAPIIAIRTISVYFPTTTIEFKIWVLYEVCIKTLMNNEKCHSCALGWFDKEYDTGI